MKKKVSFALFWAAMVFIAICFRFYFDIAEVIKGYREDLQNVTYTQLVFDEHSQKYNVECNGAKHEFSTFSQPEIFGVDKTEMAMFPGKEVVCFEYHDDFWVYPKSQFEGSDIKLLVWATALYREMLGVFFWATLLLGFVYIASGVVYDVKYADYGEIVKRSDS